AALLPLLVDDGEPAVRAASALALARLAGPAPEVSVALRQRLADRSTDVRDACLEALELLGEPAAPELRQVSMLAGSGRWADCTGLASPEVVDLLLQVLGERPTGLIEGAEADRRPGAALALGRLHGPVDLRVEPALLAALAEDVPELQAEAARALGELRLDGACPALHGLATAPDVRVRTAAVAALGRIAGPAELELLHAALADGATEVRAAALGGLGRLGPPALALLTDVLQTAPEEALRAAAAAALGQLALPEAIEPLVQALDDPAAVVREQSRQALVLLGWESVEEQLHVRRLLVALDEPDARRRQEAAEQLGLHGDLAAELVIAALPRLQDDGVQAVRTAASQALVRLGVAPLAEACWSSYWLALGDWGALARIGRPAIPELADELASHPRRDRRAGAAAALGAIADGAAVAALRAALADDDPVVRRAAAEGLGRHRAPEVIPELVPLLADPACAVEAGRALAALGETALVPLAKALADGPPEVRPGAARALGFCGLAEAFPLLARALGADDGALRCAAAEALGQLGQPQAVPLLVGCLRQELDGAVRHAMIVALGQLGDRQAIPALQGHLAEPVAEIRQACATALAALGEPPADELLAAAGELAGERWAALAGRGEIALELLVAALGSFGLDRRSAAYRAGAARVLGLLRRERGLQPLLQALRQDAQPLVRAAAAQALGHLGLPAAALALRQGLVDSQEEVRTACADALAELGEPVVPELLQAAAAIVRADWAVGGKLGEPAVELLLHVLEAELGRTPAAARARGAARALGTIGDQRALEPLGRALSAADPALRTTAAWALGDLGLPGVRPLLEGAAGAAEPALRAACMQALCQLGSIEDQPLLQRALDDPAAEVRQAMLEGLAGQGPAAAGLLRDALRHPHDPALRRRAAELLGQQGGPEAIPTLVQALDDEDVDVRQEAARALELLGWGSLERKQQVRQLCRNLTHPEAELRRATALRLAELGDEEAVPALLPLLLDPDFPVRVAAGRALAAAGQEPQLEPTWIPYWLNADTWEPLVQLGPAAVPPLAASVGQPRKDWRLAAVRALSGIMAPAALPPLLLALGDAAPEVRGAAALGLGRRRAPEALPGLLALLGDEACIVEAAEALASLGDASFASLVEATTAGNLTLQRGAAMALGLGGRAEALEPLGRLALEGGGAAVRRAALQAIERLGLPADAVRPRVAVPLQEALRADGDDETRRIAARLLGRFGVRDAAAQLRQHLAETSSALRLACREALVELGEPPDEALLAAAEDLAAERWSRLKEHGEAAVELLLAVLATTGLDPLSVASRVQAAGTLGEIRSPRCRQPLVAALGDADVRVRAAAVRALGRLGDPALAEPLLALWERSAAEPALRSALLEALALLGGEQAEAKLGEALYDVVPEVRVGAVQAM
ncbi:MAG: hypothetical protein FJ125_03220, partial [Deltaproteobacteria bacterium]|nr:hypothetical protein [Deltaproteobacteria bacterium]